MSDAVQPYEDKARRKYHLVRRQRAALEGRHLPTFDELMSGFPLMTLSVAADAQAFAERVLPRVERGMPKGDALAKALEQLTVVPGKEQFVAAAVAFRGAIGLPEPVLRNPSPTDGALRCDFYAACEGCCDSAWLTVSTRGTTAGSISPRP